MTLDDLRAELDAGQVRSSYLVVGAEPLLRDDALEAIRRAALAEDPSDFDYERLDGETVTGAALLDAVGTLPVLAPRRLVVLREPESARARARGLTDSICEALVALKGNRDSVLVVLADKVDGRSRWVKAFGSAALVRCDPPKKGAALSAFIAAEASRQGIGIDRAAIALLAERTGPQLLMLRQEIAKAALFAGPGEKVKAKHVAESTSDVAEEPIWDLTDAIGEGRCGDALVVLGKLLRSGSAPPAILGAFVNHFRKLTSLRNGGVVAGPPFAIRKLEGQSGRFSPGRLLSCLAAIHQTDLALKGAGGIAPELALERLVIALSS
ncbi:MAG: DNA polymerase III subunit delta [Deltaproteobacteria bacterium]|jgi:DNA polymerase-3 subunit delta|nr:DNA polymerase III subunit delta [Deltaproteobacteria bacterium]MBW2540528.1 DNA polymerase III subunit delta [Deltaproteobacteria bacterium]